MSDTEIKKESKIISINGGRRKGAGRPKGRKSNKTLEIEAAAKLYADDALSALANVAQHGKSESARVMAATALLDRGYGRPRQAVEHSGPQGGPIELRANEIRERFASRISGLATRIGASDTAPGLLTSGAGST